MNKKSLTALSLSTLLTILSGCSDRIPRNELDALLLNLEKSNPSVKKPALAMCYYVALTPDVKEYLCPVCHKRSKYSNKNSGEQAFWLQYKLNKLTAYRNEVKALQPFAEKYGLTLSLDERDLCPFCRPDKNEKIPGYYLLVKDKEGRKARTKIDRDDFTLLNAFFNGKTIWGNGIDEYKLKEKIPRIKKLLGLEYLDNSTDDSKKR